MPQAIIIGGPLDGRRVLVADTRPKFLELVDDAGNKHHHLEVDVQWGGEKIEDPIFVHTALHRADLNVLEILIAGYRVPRS